jgi:LmbE family N-acetylglucosaminyl deacetylase
MRGPGGGIGLAQPVSVVVFGAHPDDCDLKAGGTAALWSARGDRVLFVSLTNGAAGHHTLGGAALARRRRAEAEAAAAELGVRYHVCDHPDGALEPTLAVREEVIALIRRERADLVLLPRPWDYHPDHRAAAQAVQDAAYMVTVPNVVPFVPHLERNPVFAYVADRFTRPCPFRPDVVVDVTPVAERKLAALHRHASQFYEWLPYNGGYLDEVPGGDGPRLDWLRQRQAREEAERVQAWRDVLARWYGPEHARGVRWAEAFEVCELGRRPTEEELRRLFPLPPG